jgi:hypothetical protein
MSQPKNRLPGHFPFSICHFSFCHLYARLNSNSEEFLFAKLKVPLESENDKWKMTRKRFSVEWLLTKAKARAVAGLKLSQSCLQSLIIQSDRTMDIVEGGVEVSCFTLWRHGNHVKEVAVSHLSSNEYDVFSLASCFVNISQRSTQCIPTLNTRASISATLLQTAITLGQTVYEFVRGLLQVSSLSLCDTQVHTVCKHCLTLILAIPAFRGKPD